MQRVCWLVALLLTLIPARVGAQTHPCDMTIAANPVINGPVVKVGFCWEQKDVDGAPAVATAFIVRLDGAVKFTGGLLPIGAASPVSGLFYYETSLTGVARGTHSVVTGVVSSDGASTFSAPFGFAIVGSAPKPTVATRATKG